MRHRRFRSFDGTSIAVQEAGSAGALVVLANGLGGSMLAWQPLLARLGPRYRLVSWDYRGLYASGAPADQAAVRIEDHCRDLEILLRRAARAARPRTGRGAVIIGWSMGVQVAVEYALTRPDEVAGLVLVCGAPGDPFAGVLHTALSRRAVPAVCRAVEYAPGPVGAVMRAVTAWPGTPELLRRGGVVAPSCDLDVFRSLARDFGRLDWAVYARTTRAMGVHDAWPRLSELRVPCLVVAGTRDLFTPVATMRAMAAAIPEAELLVLEGASHYAPVEFPEELCSRIDAFLGERVVPDEPGTGTNGRGVGAL